MPTTPTWRNIQVNTGFTCRISSLAMMSSRLPQNRAMTTNTGSMAEMWLGASTKPPSLGRFSRPITRMRKPMCHTSQAAVTIMQ